MTKTELIKVIAEVLRTNNLRKQVHVNKQTFHISDDNGNSKDFIIKAEDKMIAYTLQDVENIINAFVAVVEDSMKRGEPVIIRELGTFGIHFRKGRKIRDVRTREEKVIPDRYVPKFYPSTVLKECVKVYEASVVELLNDFQVSSNIQAEETNEEDPEVDDS